MANSPSTGRARFSPGELAVVAGTLLYVLGFGIAAVVLKNGEFIFYLAVMCILIVAVVLVHLRVRFPIAALWGLSLWGLAHMAGGLMPVPLSWPILGEGRVLYNWQIVPGWLKYDQVVHAYGFGMTTWICWLCLKSAFANRGVVVQPTAGLMTLCVAGGMGFGAANEVVEFIATLTLPSTNVGGYINTGWDLIANMTGALLAGGLIMATGSRD